MVGALWDTIWTTDPALGTIGDWDIAGMRGMPPADPVLREGEEPEPLPGETVAQAANSGGLKSVDPLGTAVLLAIASDARLPDYMVGRFGFTMNDQQEWHGNTTKMETDEEPLGSLLWVLRRAPLTEYTAKMAEHFCALSLQPLVRQKIVQGFEIHAEIDRGRGMLAIQIRAVTKQGERFWTHDLYPIQ